MSTTDPLLDRLRAHLRWPSWSDWASITAAPPSPVTTHDVDHDRRREKVSVRLARAATVSDGGPYLEVFGERLEASLERETGKHVGPLADMTFAVKDLIAVEGSPVTAGSLVRDDAPTEHRSAPIVEQLEALGACAVGRVTLHEFAFGVTGANPYAGTAPNPAAPGRLPGGSSSGSASAVADGSARIALGTDTGGSIRIPASFCGVFGFKPSYGRYPAAGVFPLSATLDHVGLFASELDDIVLVHGALGHEPPNRSRLGRIGIARADFDAADESVRRATTAVLGRLEHAGVQIVDVALPDPELVFVASTTIMFSEAAAVHAESLVAHADRYGADIASRLETGAALSGVEVAAAHRLRRELAAQVRATLRTVDAIVGPTTPLVAPRLDEADDPALPARIVANTRLGNVVGLPAISLPVASDGPPVGLQLMGATDAGVLAAARAVEPHRG